MAQGFGLGKEVLQGIGISLVCISIGVFIGSQVAAATSHGPEPHGEEHAQEEVQQDGAESPKDDAKEEAPATKE